jgi:hypothetical protein
MQPINHNLMNNFNNLQSNTHSDSYLKKSDIFQTPKSTSKINNTLLFSPEEINKTPMSERTITNQSGRKYNINYL